MESRWRQFPSFIPHPKSSVPILMPRRISGAPTVRSEALLLFAVFAAQSFVTLSSAAAEDDDDEIRAGLVGRFTDENGLEFERIDRTIAFDWGTRPPDRRLGEGTFNVRWQGKLMSQAPGVYQLSAYVSGRLKITLNGKVLLEGRSDEPAWLNGMPVDLPFGYHALDIEYRKTSDSARMALFWSGPQFQLEPIGPRQFYHEPEQSPSENFARGELLVRALRCAACHSLPGERDAADAPDLSRLAGNISRQWLIHWLADNGGSPETAGTTITRRMPQFDLSRDDAESLAAFLLHQSKPPRKRSVPKGDRKQGQQLVLTVGCLACHQLGPLGDSGLFGGGDLSQIVSKRPAEFFSQWLSQPSELNANHRMPVFELTSKERDHVATYLATLGNPQDLAGKEGVFENDPSLVARGRELFVQHRCAACHHTAEKLTAEATADAPELNDQSNWQRACTIATETNSRRPRYVLTAADQLAVEQFIAAVSRVKNPAAPAIDGKYLLAERNCLACHARDTSEGLAAKLSAVAAAHAELTDLIPAMTPPPLISVGDKLYDKALADAIRRTSGVHRPWLAVRMPKFNLSDDELQALVQHFVSADRVPDRAEQQVASVDTATSKIAGARLVTTDGFGCTSCHQVGQVIPPKAPLNARGPDLSMLGTRIRREWFDRWVRNPARIVPRMEMPSVQLPVRGVLGENLDEQLAAVWQVLNQPGFEPPKPDAVRVVRRSGVSERDERAAVLTDVLRDGESAMVRPFLIGLPNRHNVLFDLEKDQLTGWWLGDTARQRTEGKTWFWEPAGVNLFPAGSYFVTSRVQLERNGKLFTARPRGQFHSELDAWQHVPGGLAFEQRLFLQSSTTGPVRDEPITVHVRHIVTAIATQQGSAQSSGFRHRMEISGVLAGDMVSWPQTSLLPLTRTSQDVALDRDGNSRVTVRPTQGADVSVINKHTKASAEDDRLVVELDYLTNLPVDQYLIDAPDAAPPEAAALNIVPGYEATRLPIPDELMPTALAWRPDGTLVVASLKGQVWLVRDKDGDGLEDSLQPLSDELAAPYGVAAGDNYVDVINKYALLRLVDDDGDGQSDRTINIASGWGHTADYHDWIVGLPRDDAGNYYIAVPCEQDNRSAAAANLHGTVSRLVPRTPTTDDPRLFGIEPISRGHRFPMGMDFNRAGELFVTDNQGNYNPFNELNHVVNGAHFGFINSLERKPGFHPPLTPPAVDIPHPWTRSVNGICFLDTPDAVKQQLGHDLFGPLEGHLIGCEYDTRRLVRMTLQKVGDTYQGAAYPFSFDQPPSGDPLLGPITCAVAPNGDLYVGSIRDSGWGGANNIGEIVRLRPQAAGLPAGIAEVRAVRDGFAIDFTAPVDAKLAANIGSYSLSSYRRISTPAYGGPDVDRRDEKIAAIEVAPDARRVTVRLKELRKGFVYELQMQNVAGKGKLFFPGVAHYTLRTIPH